MLISAFLKMNNITPKKMIKKGDAFVCINTVIMDENPNDIAYAI